MQQELRIHEDERKSSKLGFSIKRGYYYSGPGHLLGTIIMIVIMMRFGTQCDFLRVKPNFLQCHHLPCVQIFGFIYNAISALSQLFNLLKIIHKGSNTATFNSVRSPLFVDSRLFYIPKNVYLCTKFMNLFMNL